MNKKALVAICLAVFVPVVSYLFVKQYSEEAIAMPRKYYMDSIISNTVDGRTSTDTVWHKTANITLTDQFGKEVSLYDIKNKIIVADFFFTRCPSICPLMTRNMRKLQQSFSVQKDGQKIDDPVVHFLSFSIDPQRDSVDALRKYAERFQTNYDNWWFLTGPKKSIYDFALNELKLGLQDGEGVDTSFIHSQKFVLLDKNYLVRGYYNGLDTVSLGQMARDIGLLMIERDKSKKRSLFE